MVWSLICTLRSAQNIYDTRLLLLIISASVGGCGKGERVVLGRRACTCFKERIILEEQPSIVWEEEVVGNKECAKQDGPDRHSRLKGGKKKKKRKRHLLLRRVM